MQYGSSLIDKIKFRDNFVMIGQKGLAQGSAVEQVLALCRASSCVTGSFGAGCSSFFNKYWQISNRGD